MSNFNVLLENKFSFFHTSRVEKKKVLTHHNSQTSQIKLSQTFTKTALQVSGIKNPPKHAYFLRFNFCKTEKKAKKKKSLKKGINLLKNKSIPFFFSFKMYIYISNRTKNHSYI